jgi:drug/metabolite transporter (DMT)-like permease
LAETPGGVSGRASLALIALLTGAMAIAFSPILATLAVERGGIGPIAAAFWRVGLAAVVFWVWLWWRGEMRPRRGGLGGLARFWPVMLAGVWFAADLAAWHWSFLFTPVANATVLANSSAVLMTLAGWLWLGERLSPVFVLGGAVALFGVVWLVLGTARPAVSHVMPTSFGDALALAAACFYTGYLLTIKRVRARFSVAWVMMLSSAAAGVGLLATAAGSGETIVPRTVTGWAIVGGLALISHVLGQGLISFALARLTASFSAVTLLIQPVLAAIWGWLILGQALTAGQAGAGVVAITGITMARLSSAGQEAGGK